VGNGILAPIPGKRGHKGLNPAVFLGNSFSSQAT
jgi:hypothetical protein